MAHKNNKRKIEMLSRLEQKMLQNTISALILRSQLSRKRKHRF